MGETDVSKYPNLRWAKVRRVIEIAVLEGTGTEENPKRLVTYYFSRNGNLLAYHDPDKFDESDPLWQGWIGEV